MQVETTNSVGMSSGILPRTHTFPIPCIPLNDVAESLFLMGFFRHTRIFTKNACKIKRGPMGPFCIP